VSLFFQFFEMVLSWQRQTVGVHPEPTPSQDISDLLVADLLTFRARFLPALVFGFGR
jgi:hypothetical protein